MAARVGSGAFWFSVVMSITVRLPTTLQTSGQDSLTITEPVENIAELVRVLRRQLPGFPAQWDDSMLNFSVNDEVVLHRVEERVLTNGDVVEIILALSGGRP